MYLHDSELNLSESNDLSQKLLSNKAVITCRQHRPITDLIMYSKRCILSLSTINMDCVLEKL